MEAVPPEQRFWGGNETSIFRWFHNVWQERPTEGLDAKRRVLVWAFFGFFMGTVFDWIHVVTGTASYDPAWQLPLMKVAYYVPVEFTIAGVLVGMVRPELDEELKGNVARLSRNSILAGLFCFCVAWGGTGLFTLVAWSKDGVPQCTSDPNYVLLALLAVLGGVTWLVFDRTWAGFFVAILMAFIGVSVEVYLVKYSLFGLTKAPTYQYTHPTFLGVPAWLPMLYIIAAGALGNMARFLKYPDPRSSY